MTKFKFELIPDPTMYIFFEKGVKDEISYISDWYSKSNNKHLKSYVLKQESKHIIYLNANNFMVKQYLDFFQQVDSKE